MNYSGKIKITSLIIVISLFVLASTETVHATTKNQLVRCADTSFVTGYYGTNYNLQCGGDNLFSGFIAIRGNHVIVSVQGALAEPFNLYEVYWMPIGGDPSSTGGDMVKIGNFITDCNGNTMMPVKDIASPIDIRVSPPADISALVGNQSAGNFWVYSRGPFGDTDRGDCKPANLNTSTGSITDPFVNPVVQTDGSASSSDSTHFIQFISGYGL